MRKCANCKYYRFFGTLNFYERMKIIDWYDSFTGELCMEGEINDYGFCTYNGGKEIKYKNDVCEHWELRKKNYQA